MKIATSSVLCSLLLFACGDKSSKAAEPSPDGFVDETHDAASEKPIALTDKLMEDYVEIAREMKKAGNAGNVAFLTRFGWSMERWVQVSNAVAQGMMSAGRAQMSEMAKASNAEIDRTIADLTARLKAAPEAEREALKAQLEALQASRISLGEFGQASDLDRRNAEVLERWKPRLEAFAQEK